MGNVKSSCCTSEAEAEAESQPIELQLRDDTLGSNPTLQTKQTQQPIIHIASTSEQQSTSEIPNKPTSPQSTSIQAQEQLAPSSYDPELLKDHRFTIVNALNRYVLAFMFPFLECYDKEEIEIKVRHSEKYGTLLDILYRLATTDRVEIFNKFMKCVASVLPDLFTQVVGRVPITSETGFYVNDTKDELSNLIKETGHMQDGTDNKIDLGTKHVQLAMVSERPGTASQLPDRYANHTATMTERADNISPLSILGNGPESVEGEAQPPINPQTKILLYGRAGIGKSTLLQWLAYQWACLEWASTFSLIFFIQLRSLTIIDPEISAVQLLTIHGLYPLTETGCKIASCMLEYFPGKIMVLLDGLDEVSKFGDRIKKPLKLRSIHDKASPTEIVINILRGDLLPKCTIISTSRPFNELFNLNIHKTFEILGLTQDRLQAFVKCHHPGNSESIMTSLNANPMLKSICSITFYGMMVTNLLSKGAIYAADDLMTYTRFTAFTSMEYLSRKYDGSFLLHVGNSFMRLAKLAYNGIFQLDNNMSKIVFNEIDVQKCELSYENIEFLVKCGVIKTQTKGNSCTVECMHLSVQEFLAAAYLVSTAAIPDNVLELLFTTGQFDMTLMFVFGFLFDTNHASLQQIYHAVNPSGEVDELFRSKMEKAFLNMCAVDPNHTAHSTLNSMIRAWNESGKLPAGLVDKLRNMPPDSYQTILKLCQIVHETQSASLARQIADYIVPDGILYIYRNTLTLLDLAAVAFVCRFSQPLVDVTLSRVNADADFVKLFVTSFDRHKDSITHLALTNNNIGDEGVASLCQLLTHSDSIISLQLGANNIGDEGVASLCQLLTHSDSIKFLHLSRNKFTNVGEQKLADLKRHKPHLHILYLDDDDDDNSD